MKNNNPNVSIDTIEDAFKATLSLHTVSSPDLNNTQFLHEVRNPLTNIDMCVSMLKESINKEDANRYLNIISHSTTVIKSIINNELNASKSNTHNSSINKLLDEALEMAADRIVLKDITITKDYSKQESNLFVDEQRIKIVFLNIIINAVEAISTKTGKINFSTKFENKKYIVVIEDNGVGISKKDMERLFDPYYTSKPDGMGLGLATALAVLKVNNASVKVKSVENEGTYFTIVFDTLI